MKKIKVEDTAKHKKSLKNIKLFIKLCFINSDNESLKSTCMKLDLKSPPCGTRIEIISNKIPTTIHIVFL